MNVLSEDGQTYQLRPFSADPERLRHLYSVFQKHDILVADPYRHDVEAYLDYMLSPSVIIWEVYSEDEEKAVGIVYADNIFPKFSARVHYIFWDLRTKGRQSLLLHAMKAFMTEFSLHRVKMEVPIYAFAALNRLRHMGLHIEGRMRATTLRHGKWQDELMFSVLDNELTMEAIERGTLDPEKVRGRWFKVLENEDALASYFLRKEN